MEKDEELKLLVKITAQLFCARYQLTRENRITHEEEDRMIKRCAETATKILKSVKKAQTQCE